ISLTFSRRLPQPIVHRSRQRIAGPDPLQKCEERATRKEQTRDNAAVVGASRLSGGAMLSRSPTSVTPLGCALTKNASISALECALTNSLDLKSLQIQS